MNQIISFILQLIVFKKAMSKQQAAYGYAMQAVTKAKGYAVLTGGIVVAAFFLVLSLVVFVLDIGLQIDRQGFVKASGLMLSAGIFLALAIVVFLGSYIPLLIKQNKKVEPPPVVDPLEPWLNLAEEYLNQLLRNLSQNPPVPPQPPASGQP